MSERTTVGPDVRPQGVLPAAERSPGVRPAAERSPGVRPGPARPAAVRRAGAAVARPARSVGLALAALALVVAAWEGYKLLGPDDGWLVGDLRLLPRTSDLAMPHVTDMLARLAEPVTGAAGAPALWVAVVQACAVSLRVATVGWVLGVGVGLLLAVLMQRVRLAERAVLPFVVLSQTVPLVALAPLVRSWGSKLEIGAFAWQGWMSVAVIASYLAFFPVAVGALRGLQSPDAIHRELLTSYGAGWGQALVHLHLPASVPYLLPALRLAAAAAVVGTVVAEVSTGLPGGVGRMILELANFASSDPAKPWAPIFGAVALGLVASGAVALLGAPLGRYRRAEVPA